MHLLVPIETTSVKILSGPGVLALTDAASEKARMGYTEPTGPELPFTVEHPITGKPLELTVEMIGNFDWADGHYELDAAVGSSYVRVEYLPGDTDSSDWGSISDLG